MGRVTVTRSRKNCVRFRAAARRSAVRGPQVCAPSGAPRWHALSSARRLTQHTGRRACGSHTTQGSASSATAVDVGRSRALIALDVWNAARAAVLLARSLSNRLHIVIAVRRRCSATRSRSRDPSRSSESRRRSSCAARTTGFSLRGQHRRGGLSFARLSGRFAISAMTPVRSMASSAPARGRRW